MEKTKETKIEKIKYTHVFYCDGCNKELGESEESSDGYYLERGEYGQNVFIQGVGWFKLKRHFCHACADKMNNEITTKLLEVGFETEMR